MKSGDSRVFWSPPERGCVAIVIARSETTKQSLFIDEIATLPSVARNDNGGYDTAPFGRTPGKEALITLAFGMTPKILESLRKQGLHL